MSDKKPVKRRLEPEQEDSDSPPESKRARPGQLEVPTTSAPSPPSSAPIPSASLTSSSSSGSIPTSSTAPRLPVKRRLVPPKEDLESFPRIQRRHPIEDDVPSSSAPIPRSSNAPENGEGSSAAAQGPAANYDEGAARRLQEFWNEQRGIYAPFAVSEGRARMTDLLPEDDLLRRRPTWNRRRFFGNDNDNVDMFALDPAPSRQRSSQRSNPWPFRNLTGSTRSERMTLTEDEVDLEAAAGSSNNNAPSTSDGPRHVDRSRRVPLGTLEDRPEFRMDSGHSTREVPCTPRKRRPSSMLSESAFVQHEEDDREESADDEESSDDHEHHNEPRAK